MSRPNLLNTSFRDGLFQVTSLDLSIKDLPKVFDGYRIAQLTDFHYGPATPLEHIKSAAEKTREFNPDLVCLTGDFVQLHPVGFYQVLATKINPKLFRWGKYRRHVRHHVELLASVLSTIPSRDGQFAIYGNHDYMEGLGTVRRKLGADITWLNNTTKFINREGFSLAISGVDDSRYGKPDLGRALAVDCPASHREVGRILLAHNPDLTISAEQGLISRTNLMLSGHTHGGQIRIPGMGPLVTRTKQKKHVSGLSWHGETPVYVSNGVGYGGIKLRILCPPEIVFITLRS